MKCEFEENAYQQVCDVYLGSLTKKYTTAGRVAESILNYDGAYYLDENFIKDLFSLNFDIFPKFIDEGADLYNDKEFSTKDTKSKLSKYKLNVLYSTKFPH